LLVSDFPLNATYEVREDSTMVGMVAQGLGAAIIPRLAAEPIPPEVQVYSLPVPLERAIGVAVVANALQTPAVFAFLDTLRDVERFTNKTAV
jgi:DNA-binding transcriptional LysR family regulator